MQRVAGKNRYPIDVVKIPMAVPLTTAFKQNIERIRRERLPKELGYGLQPCVDFFRGLSPRTFCP